MTGNVIVGSGRFSYDGIGTVHYVVRSQARQFTARWKNGELQLSVPPRMRENQVYDALEGMKPALLRAKRKQQGFHIGQVIDAGDFKVVLKQSELKVEMLQAVRIGRDWVISVPGGTDLESHDFMRGVTVLLRKIAMREAPAILIPRARILAAETGQHPEAWSIGKGMRILGRCSSKGYISLSCMLVYYPEEIRDYVIYHELAHLSEMNHSPRFHELCDRYCKGRERELVSRLKSIKLY